MKRTPVVIKTRHKQRVIAEKLGVTQPTVSNWLNMRVKPEGLPKQALKHNYPDLYKRINIAWNQQSMTSSKMSESQ
jgi:predicted transcriptional regulator